MPDGHAFTAQDAGANRAIDSSVNVRTGISGEITLSGGNTLDDGLDIGLIKDNKDASITATVSFDNDKDGLRDSGEQLLSGVEVKLLDKAGEEVATGTTNNSGQVVFDDLSRGEYQLDFGTTQGFVFTKTDTETENGSDVDSEGKSPVIFVDAAAEATVDAGLRFAPTASISSVVWFDENKNGLKDANEKGESGVEVKLLNASGDEVGKTTTDADGKYEFTGLFGGEYKVAFDNPDDIYKFSDKHTSFVKAATDNQGNTLTSTFFADSPVRVPDNGNLTPADFDFKDGNGVAYKFGTNTTKYDSVPVTGSSTIVDSDVDSEGQITLTVKEDTAYDHVAAGLIDSSTASIGNFVWFDADGNGIMDGNEGGVADVAVKLLDEDGEAIADKTTTTDANGFYSFTGLDSGKYMVQFTAPDGQAFTATDGGSATEFGNDLDADQNGRTSLFEIGIGHNERRVDAGLRKAGEASISGLAFMDANSNGEADAAAGTVAAGKVLVGHEVRLLNADGKRFASTTTDAEGKYSFTKLIAGTYTVEFGGKDGFIFTTADGGADAQSATQVEVIELLEDTVKTGVNAGFAAKADVPVTPTEPETPTEPDTPTVEPSAPNVIEGGNGGETLSGTDGADNINAGGGADKVMGGAGDDEMRGGRGNDELRGGSGDDSISGNQGNDTLYGAKGDDWLSGDAGDDLLYGGAGNDTLLGGQGEDVLRGGSGDDYMMGGAGNDMYFGGKGTDTVVFAGSHEGFSAEMDGNMLILTHGNSVETMRGVEVLEFGDVTVTVDELEAANFDFDSIL